MTPLWNTRGRPTNKASQLDSADESGRPGDDDQLQNGHSEPAPAPSDVLPSLGAHQLSALRLQSTALALMALRGDLPASFARPMAAVVADTGFEPRRVYEHLLG